MNDTEHNKEVRKQRRLEMLGTNDPRCGMCGEGDWRCIELHHVAGRARHEATVRLCRNCHRKVSDDQKDHPPHDPNADPLLDTMGHYLFALADMLSRIVLQLYAFALALIERASPTPASGQAK